MDVCPAFVDETGVLSASPKAQPVYGIGLLVAPDPKAITDKLSTLHFRFREQRITGRRRLIRNIREGVTTPTIDEWVQLTRTTQHHEYKFSAVARHNLQDYVSLLALYLSLGGMEFHSLILDRTDPAFDYRRWGEDPWDAYLAIAQELLRRRLKRPVFAIVDFQGKPKKARAYLEDRLCTLPHVTGCLRASSETSVFLQIVDLLLGCVQFDWKDQRGYYKASANTRAKRDLTIFLKSHLGIAAGEPIVSESLRFRKRRRLSLFTTWWARP